MENLSKNKEKPNPSPATKIRSISEILKEADATDELTVLSDSWKEIVANIEHYPLVEIRFAKEHLVGLAKKMAKEHAEMMMPFFNSLFNNP
ncbi:hypothetical protein [Cyclobacterium jeungdonense]|uniref:Uncharacterized protein n=1 Tax=Cyclobacterium jeungdonense TaxID=708087 RepID=A0ABT8C8K3_9BACT|nr:hypothetical protein [Cyclobacterium jeungdonense]MDN3688701.1 hypothetical protein [Cyclobacterium jeungdonense]